MSEFNIDSPVVLHGLISLVTGRTRGHQCKCSPVIYPMELSDTGLFTRLTQETPNFTFLVMKALPTRYLTVNIDMNCCILNCTSDGITSGSASQYVKDTRTSEKARR